MKMYPQTTTLMNEQAISVNPQDLLYSFAKGNFTFLVLTDDKSASEPAWVKWVKKLTHMNPAEMEQQIESSREDQSQEEKEYEQLLQDSFLAKLIETIEKNLDNPDLTINDLCQAHFVSHMQLYRKVKSKTGKSPVQLIRLVRLLKSREMLRTTSMNISEIAYEVVFSDPNYFSRTFHKEFGMAPTSFRQ